MGFSNNGKQITYAATHLSRPDSIVVGTKRMLERPPQTGQVIGHPWIAVDCNNVINIVGRKSVDPVGAVWQVYY